MSAYCNNCGAAAMGASFCAACGASIGASQIPTTGGQYGIPQPATPASFSAAMWSHLSTLLTGVLGIFCVLPVLLTWLPPLLIRNKFRNDPFVYRHATDSLNFQIQWLILAFASVIASIFTLGLSLFLTVGAAIFQIIVVIMASVAANAGRAYVYPLQFINLVK